MDIPSANKKLVRGENLSREEMQSVMSQVMQGKASDAQIGAFLIALMIKGETVEEIIGAADIMLKLSAKVPIRSNKIAPNTAAPNTAAPNKTAPNTAAVDKNQASKITDCVGTGGDGARLFNVSTASALVAAAAGATMAKHGNRAATGNSGSADVLETAGVNIAITPEQVGQCIEQCGIGFMFAPTHHAAMRFCIAARQQIGVRTVFNLLGPLTNPAGAKYQLAGVFDQQWCRKMAESYAVLGSVHTLVACSDDGLDEISIAADTLIVEYRAHHKGEFSAGKFSEYKIKPEDYGVNRQSLSGLEVDDAAASLALIKAALGGQKGAAYDIICLNAGATIYAGDLVETYAQGVDLARQVLSSGQGLEKLEHLIRVSNSFAEL